MLEFIQRNDDDEVLEKQESSQEIEYEILQKVVKVSAGFNLKLKYTYTFHIKSSESLIEMEMSSKVSIDMFRSSF